ncbi:MAG TPA: nucleoside triphosphate pyrophosphohydrolase [Firmicutes bacterium]|nr:nucleoside triphosphate pyrophosphohydrolase [Bacillota bacterium]
MCGADGTRPGEQKDDCPWHRFESIIKRLRGPDGCPWDKQQTYQSLRPFVLEEAYEVVQAASEQDADKLREELGDLMLQVGLYAEIAEEKEHFTLADVIDGISDKLVRRHPHVFGDRKADTPEQVEELWAEIKRNERGKSPCRSEMDRVAQGQPALMRAQQQQAIAAQVGFDWPDVRGVFEKLAEEISELREAWSRDDQAQIEAEIGDLLFACVNLARWLGVDAEVALTRTIDKFSRRFRLMEAYLEQYHLTIKEVAMDTLDELWEKAKDRENRKG